MRAAAFAVILVLLLAGCAGAPPPSDNGTDPYVEPQTLQFEPAVDLGAPTVVDGAGQFLEEARLAADPTGTVRLVCFHGRFVEFSPTYATADGGVTWRRLSFPVATGLTGDCDVALMADGTWVVLGAKRSPFGMTVAVSRDEGASWVVADVLPPTTGRPDRPWLLARGQELWLSAMPLETDPGPATFRKSTDNGATWTDAQPVGPFDVMATTRTGPFTSNGDRAHFPMVSFGVRGLEAAKQTVLQLATTEDEGQSWTVEDVYDGADLVADWPAFAVTADGYHVLAATMILNDHLTLAAFTRLGEGEWSSPTPLYTINTTDRDSLWPSMAGARDGNVTWIVSDAQGQIPGTPETLVAGRFNPSTGWVEAHELGAAWTEFASVTHDETGNAYFAWSDWEHRWLVKATAGE